MRCVDDKEPDYNSDFWADHDEKCHGVIDDLVDEPGYEDGFFWRCCEQPATLKGCRIGKHRPAKMSAKRARI